MDMSASETCEESPRILDKTFVCTLNHEFNNRGNAWSIDVHSHDFAKRLDKEDPLREFRKKFCYPKKKDIRGNQESFDDNNEDCIYFCGHSLGLQLKCIKDELHDVLDNWAKKGVHSHFVGKFPAAYCDSQLKEKMAYLVGAQASEVAIMNSLTVNIHVLLSSFYNPTSRRHKILMLDNGFHSDLYAVQSHIRLRGYNPEESLVFLKPKSEKQLLNPNDILSFIKKEGKDFALIFLEGVHFYTGQLFDMKKITLAGHEQGCTVGFDLAHAVGNVKLKLHDWDVDFAMWCTYKYLNCGAGSLGAIFVHQRHTDSNMQTMPRMAGWWGIKDKFVFSRDFDAAEGADRFKVSNPSPFLIAMISANLDVFKEATIERLFEKQRLLTGYLEYLLRKTFSQNCEGDETKKPTLRIITPSNPNKRGCQISLQALIPVCKLENLLKEKGIVCDVRKSSIIRVTPVPLYNTFTEVYQFVHILRDIFEKSLHENENIK